MPKIGVQAAFGKTAGPCRGPFPKIMHHLHAVRPDLYKRSLYVHDPRMDMSDQNGPRLMPGQLLARGVCRHLLTLDFVTVEELTPAPGLRVDVMGLGPKGEIWIIECKSGRADFAADRKWQNYLEWGDRFFWAVDGDFPVDLLPAGTGLILADSYDAEILRLGSETPLPPARRKMMTARFARHAALRHHAARDPSGVSAERFIAS